MKKRIFSMLLAVIMVLGSFPVTAWASETPTPITSVAISVNPEPEIGEVFSFDNISGEENANYFLWGKSFTDVNNPVVSGKVYRLTTSLRPNVGYCFSDTTTATVNGKTATAEIMTDSPFEGWLKVSYEYDFSHFHSVCGDNECTNHGDAVMWTAWDKVTTLPTSGNYYLTGNVTLPSMHTLTDDLNLCLNGNQITTSGVYTNAIEVPTGKTMNICDCSVDKNGSIKGGSTSGRGINNYGNLNIYSGTVSSNSAHAICNYESASCKVFGGAVTSTNNVGIYNNGDENNKGTVIISGGTVGEVYNFGAVTLQGGQIKDESGTGIYNGGGSSFTMTGGTITAKTAVNNYGTASISNGAVNGYVVSASNGSLTVTGGTFSYSSSTNVTIFHAGSSFTLSGTTAITNSGGSAAIALANGRSITIGEGGLTGSTPYSVRTVNNPTVNSPIAITTGTETADYSDKFTVIDADKYEITSVKTEGKYQVFLAKKPTPIVGTLTLSGTEKFGETLTANYTGSETVTYQWYRGDELIDGATDTVYTLTVDDIGNVITVKVTGTDNYTGEKSASSALVSKTDFASGDVTAQGYTGAYDEAAHGITVNAPAGATVKYGTVDGVYDLDESPTYTEVSENKVYFKVTMAGYIDYTGDRNVIITPKSAASPEVPTAQNSVTYGATLSTVGLTSGWTWANGDVVPTVQNNGYTAYFTPSDTKNYDWTAVEGWNADKNRVERTVAVTVNKADPLYNAPTAKENLVYTGGEKVLVNSGSATGGTMQYAIGTQTAPTTSFSTYIPVGKGAGTYYVWYKVAGDSNHNDIASACVTVTIAKAALTVTAKNKTITYGDAPENDGVTYTGFVGADDETALKGALVYDYRYTQFGNVGDYEIIPDGLSSDNYEIIFNKGTLTVLKKEIGIDWSNTALIYNGMAQKPTAAATGAVNGDVLTLTVNGEQTDVSDTAYTATVTGISGRKAGNYKLPTNVTTDFTISYLAAKPEMYTVIADYEKDGIYWFKAEDTVTVAAGTGYQISTAANGTFGDSVTFGGNDTFKIYIQEESTGTFTDVIDLSSILMTDALLPGGEIKIDERNAWQSFVNAVTFDLFFKDEKTATVTVSDYDECGIKSVEYFLANDLPDISGEKNEAVAKLEAVVQAAGGWKTYTAPVGLGANAQNLLFVKITDNVGRVAYLNSEGIVLDSIAPTFQGIENGGVYYGDKIFKANDDNFDKIEVDGNDITNTTEGDDEYKIVADNAEHTVTVTDKAGNVTEYKITVYKNYTVTFKVDGETLTTETVGHGKDATLPSIPEKVGYTQTAPAWDKDGKNITDDTEINAVYTINKYTVTYKADGEVIGTVSVEHGKDATALTIPAKDGYTQTAPVWDKDGKNITTDTEITAVYAINEYTITFMGKNGVYKTLTCKHGETVVMPDVPTKDGYTVKWDTTIDKATGDATVKAVYIEIPKTDTPSTPQTGDNSNIFLWIALLFISGGAVVTLTVYDKKQRATK